MPVFWGLIFVSGVAAFFWAFVVEPHQFHIRYFQLNLSKPLKRNYRVLHLSDIHFSGPRKKLSWFFDRLAKESYDFIFLTGDIFDCAQGAPYATEEIRKLKSRHGIFAVWGNHDHYDYRLSHFLTGFLRKHPKHRNPIEILAKSLLDAGVQILRNETVEVRDGEDVFLVHGVDDPVTRQADVDKIVGNVQHQKANFLLTHTIDVFYEIPEDHIDVSFSGHSHGGQVRVPGVGPIITHTRFGRDYAKGVKALKGTACVISQGMGTSRFLKPRFLCPPEALVLEIGPKR